MNISLPIFYNLRSNKYDKDIENDSGMYGRDVMKLLKKHDMSRKDVSLWKNST